MKKTSVFVLALLSGSSVSTGSRLSTSAAQTSGLEKLEQETVERLRAYLQVDTVNPPGNESRAVAFLPSFSTPREFLMRRRSRRPVAAICGRV